MIGHARRGRATPSHAMLVGQTTGPFSVSATGRVDLIAARLEPHGAALCVRHVAPQPMDRREGDGVLSPTQSDGPGGTATRRAGHCHSGAERSGREAGPDARVTRSVERIGATDGAVPVADLAAEAGTTERHLQRLFGAGGLAQAPLPDAAVPEGVCCPARRPRQLGGGGCPLRLLSTSTVRDFNAFARAPAGLIAGCPSSPGSRTVRARRSLRTAGTRGHWQEGAGRDCALAA
jgi:hypothetical protein